jgi:iron-sulfur cluster assembly protein
VSATIANENILSLTPEAAAEYRSLQSQPDNGGKNVRFYVEKGGCSGMQYGMVFDEKRDGDLVSEQHGVTVLVDPISADFLRGTVVGRPV